MTFRNRIPVLLPLLGSFHPALTQTVRLLLNEIERRFFEALHHPPRVDRADAADHARSEIPPDPLNI